MKKGLVIFFLLIYLSTNMVIIANAKEELDLYALSAILMEKETGRVLYELNAYENRAMASTTKIMTCIVALEKGNLEDIVDISQRAASAPKVKLYIKNGEKYRLEDLLYALMLQSSNDVAVAIAEHIGGSVEEFCDLMTLKAEQIGALNTCYKTPNGLDAKDHYSTAYDLALITQYALQNEKFVEIINTPSWHISKANGNSRDISLTNKNAWLNSYRGAYGVKTGYTGEAGYCFVGVARRDGMNLISVVLGSGWPPNKSRRWLDTNKLMNYGFENFTMKEVLKENMDFQPIKIIKGKEEYVSTFIDGYLQLPLCDEDHVEIKYKVVESKKAPIEKGEILGLATIYVNDEIYDNFYIRASNSVEKQDLKFNFHLLFDKWVSNNYLLNLNR